MRHNLPPLLSQILCSSPPFVDDLFSVYFLCISFSCCYSLDIRLFTFAFFCCISCSSCCILPIVVSFNFLHLTLSFISAAIFVCKLIRNCKILRIAVQLQPLHNDFPLKTWVANYFYVASHLVAHVKASCNA